MKHLNYFYDEDLEKLISLESVYHFNGEHAMNPLFHELMRNNLPGCRSSSNQKHTIIQSLI